MFRKTTMRRAVIEGLLIYVAGQLLALIAIDVWPAVIFPVVLIVRMTLFVLPPVWAAMRVVSTRREKMSRRFWLLGPTMAVFAALISAVITLVAGETGSLGGIISKPDWVRFGMSGAAGLTPGAFALGALGNLGLLLVYYTIAVIFTRLANGGFMRFTMPAGKGRVTL
jgi:hypothetical protein